ncbi:universal stress protein [Myxococcus llanfairpwllgwyngyllgogerychwyrndrobwllllantysiliogogogochensis]|uniref:Universal stress protein n=1 Tax=Myxococcus llanfairpwllgwyngyllgogerychwyrndrobwllllantysiliogogogochensis TaxID=2590453 RepID=A0A540X140_9BACT|nr:universal stress protein [Myxococcus llanfairpwllgwyngyllgogerychwyrndrobwllllantysiliogogogochensis]TQF14966.1 universal stress protein [Myxococcus llanfairpwllgwyngyllgogerychwyrndrobwllllantysiliogogogochensis]
MRQHELTRLDIPLLSPGPSRGPRGMTRLVVATDFSLRSELALARALRLPLGMGATFTVMHAGPPLEGSPAGIVAGERCLRKAVSAVARRLRQRQDVTVHEELRRGDAVDAAVAVAREQGAELVVLGGTHVTAPGRELGERSTVRRMVRRLDTSVLTVLPHPARPYASPLVAVDFSRESRRALELTLRLCPLTLVEVLHVVDTRADEAALRARGASPERFLVLQREREDAARVALARFLAPYRETGRELEARLRGGEPGESILAHAAELGTDLLALAGSGQAEGCGVSLAERVLARSSCDVLVSRHEGRAVS